MFGFENIDLIGTVDEILEKIGKLCEAGVTQPAWIFFPANSVDELSAQMTRFGEESFQPFGNGRCLMKIKLGLGLDWLERFSYEDIVNHIQEVEVLS